MFSFQSRSCFNSSASFNLHRHPQPTVQERPDDRIWSFSSHELRCFPFRPEVASTPVPALISTVILNPLVKQEGPVDKIWSFSSHELRCFPFSPEVASTPVPPLISTVILNAPFKQEGPLDRIWSFSYHVLPCSCISNSLQMR